MKGRGGNRLWSLMAFFYEQFFRNFPPHQKLLQALLQNVGKPISNAGLLLDAGCGPGLLSLELARQGHKVLGIDRSSEMLKRAQEKRERGKLENLFFLERDLNLGLSGREYSFNKILFIHSLYLMDDPGETLRKLATTLAEDGQILMCNPSRRLTFSELLEGGWSFLKEALNEKSPHSFFSLLGIALAVGSLHVVIQIRKKRVYHCWDEREIEELLRTSGFRLKWLRKSCLGESHLLLCAEKER